MSTCTCQWSGAVKANQRLFRLQTQDYRHAEKLADGLQAGGDDGKMKGLDSVVPMLCLLSSNDDK